MKIKKDDKTVKILLSTVSPVLSGFGMFWLYRLLEINVWVCILLGLLTSSLLTDKSEIKNG